MALYDTPWFKWLQTLTDVYLPDPKLNWNWPEPKDKTMPQVCVKYCSVEHENEIYQRFYMAIKINVKEHGGHFIVRIEAIGTSNDCVKDWKLDTDAAFGVILSKSYSPRGSLAEMLQQLDTDFVIRLAS
jgi:hypothetical protein